MRAASSAVPSQNGCGGCPARWAEHALQRPAAGQARVTIGDGWLHLRWTALAPRRLALVRIPRLHVEFRFEGVAAPARQVFMSHFDRYMQRGGG